MAAIVPVDTCRSCLKDFPYREFVVGRTIRARCRKCFAGGVDSWKERNRDHRNAYAVKWKSAHRDEVRSRQRVRSAAYRKNNKAKLANAASVRRAARRGVTADLDHEGWLEILRKYGSRCAYCGALRNDLTQDHIVPLARGGKHTASNVVPSCRSCNARKGSRSAPPFVVTSVEASA